MATEVSRMEAAVREWISDYYNQSKLAYKLDHEYTAANLSFSSLKGRDKEIFQRLRSLKDKFGDPLLVIKMVTMEKEERGEAEASFGRYGSSYSG